jgi:hypothetical protein
MTVSVDGGFGTITNTYDVSIPLIDMKLSRATGCFGQSLAASRLETRNGVTEPAHRPHMLSAVG